MHFSFISQFFSNLLQYAVEGVRSSWSYETSAGVEVNVSPLARILTVGGEGLRIDLYRGDEHVELVHAGLSGGAGIAIAGEVVSVGGGTKEFPSKGLVIHMPWADDFKSSRDFLGPSVAVQL